MDTTSLRWRARVAKTTQQDDDDDYDGDSDDGDHRYDCTNDNRSTRTDTRREVKLSATAQQQHYKKRDIERGRGDDQNDDYNDDDKAKTCCIPRTPCGFIYWYDTLSMTAVLSGITTFVTITTSYTADVASALTAVIGAYTMYQQRRLKYLGSFRKQINALRNQSNQLQLQNEALTRKLEKLDGMITQLEGVENQLRKYTGDKEEEMERLLTILERQQNVHQKIKESLQCRIMQHILEVIVMADQNADFQISQQELETLVFRMHSIAGVQFHEKNFRMRMAIGERKLSTVMQLIRELMADDDENNDIFTLRPELLTKTDKISRSYEA